MLIKNQNERKGIFNNNNLLDIQRVIAIGTVRKVRRELKNCVRTERLHGALDTVHGPLKSMEYAFNLLRLGLPLTNLSTRVVIFIIKLGKVDCVSMIGISLHKEAMKP